MKYLKLLSISLFMFVFAIACQAGEDNRTVYDENTSDAYSETMDEGDKEDHEGDKEDHEGDDDHEGHDHESEIIDALSNIEGIVDPNNLLWPRKVIINDKMQKETNERVSVLKVEAFEGGTNNSAIYKPQRK